MRMFLFVLVLGNLALVLFVAPVVSYAQPLSDVSVMPRDIPASLIVTRAQPAFGPAIMPGIQPLTSALLANYVERQQVLRAVDVASLQPDDELTTDMLMSYIARSALGSNSAVSAIAGFANPVTALEEAILTPTVLAAYIESDYKPLALRIETADRERNCLAQAIYHEARGESDAGQLAVANVIVNRARSGRFPSTLCGVIYQNANKGLYRCQFTFACDGRSKVPSERRAWVRSVELAKQVYAAFAQGRNPGAVPDSALYYHTISVHPSWANSYNAVASIGSHIFYSPN